MISLLRNDSSKTMDSTSSIHPFRLQYGMRTGVRVRPLTYPSLHQWGIVVLLECVIKILKFFAPRRALWPILEGLTNKTLQGDYIMTTTWRLSSRALSGAFEPEQEYHSRDTYRYTKCTRSSGMSQIMSTSSKFSSNERQCGAPVEYDYGSRCQEYEKPSFPSTGW